MQNAPVHLNARTQVEPSNWELFLRYAAATVATLLAIAGAQLVVRNDFIVLLVITTLVGVPVSLYLRLSDMKVGSVRVPRFLLNSMTLMGTLAAAAYYILWSMREQLGRVLNGASPQTFFMTFGASDLVSLLMQVFLLFAAFRSFALISDKDATLTTVPSFSVLLLLIPVHKGVEVVFYFLAWTIVATLLFALDHRSEIRASASALVPSAMVGQDVRMAGRSLATILSISMVAAVGISYYLTSRNPDQRSNAESAISSLATRLTNMALSLPESSVNSGPERQIDFSANPSTLTRSALWRVQAWSKGGKPERPEYWRLFSLDRYNGQTWSQSNVMGGKSTTKRVKATELSEDRWPTPDFFRPQDGPGESSRPDVALLPVPQRLSGGLPQRANPPQPVSPPQPINPPLRRGEPERFNGPQMPFNTDLGGGFRPPDSGRRYFRPGFDLGRAAPDVSRQFGKPQEVLVQNVTAIVPNIGYVPTVPSVRAVRLGAPAIREVRFQRDGAIDLGVVETQQRVRFVADVPGLAEYGVARASIPATKPSAQEIKRSGLSLTDSDRRLALSLPRSLPRRVRDLAKQTLANVAANESNYRRAQRLALEIQKDSVYTLRPPSIPADRDAADYFLFEGKRRGYCTYFAGALTVLCRSQKIPARVVSGFVNPEWDPGSGSGLLREANAHAWTEVWVDGWGWAVVDATPADDRGDNAPTWLESWSDLFTTNAEGMVEWIRTRMIVVGVASFVALLFMVNRFRKRRFGFSFRFNFRYDEDAERRAVIDIYRALTRQISKRFRAQARWETPDEWLQPYAATLEIPDAEALRRLTSLYLMARYATKPLPQGSARLARDSAAYIRRKKKKNKVAV